MPLRNTSESFGSISIALHWLSALAVLGLFACGYWMVELNYYDPLYTILPKWHEAIGLLLALATALRLFWKAFNPHPAGAKSEPKIQSVLAHLAHHALMLGVVAVLISGYLISTAGNTSIDVFGWFEVPPAIPSFDNQEDVAGYWHWLIAWGLIALTAAHAGAALWHQLIKKDGTLRRMWKPGTTLSPPPQ